MYLCNFTRLDLGLEGTPDPSVEEVMARAVGVNYKGYIGPEYAALAPSSGRGQGQANAQAGPSPAPPAPGGDDGVTVKKARR